MFKDSAISNRWLKARQRIIEHLLRSICNSIWYDNLVLRGSLLLKAWLGDMARNPGDIDWVFQPQDVDINDPLSQQLFDDFIAMVAEQPYVRNATIEMHKISIEDIWTYERAQGRRIVFPWKVDGLPLEIQMDVVFREELFVDTIVTEIPASDGDNILVRSASPELSLAWKLLWLETDIRPQGKDLYDATLLAERIGLPFELLDRILRAGGWNSQCLLSPDFPLEWEVDWENFKLEYPAIEGEAKDWQMRLTKALATIIC
jgi:predicted nucleotidyltransferase component of viral defense system